MYGQEPRALDRKKIARLYRVGVHFLRDLAFDTDPAAARHEVIPGSAMAVRALSNKQRRHSFQDGPW
jgi:hypothetical protein